MLASNTSYLDLDAIAAATSRPQDVIGLHFFSPANVMKLMEVVRGTASAPDALATGLAVGRKLKKLPVLTGNAFGFVGNRLYAAYRRQCEFMVEEGAWPEQVDAALEAFGFAMGPFAVADLSGLDIAWRMRQAQAATRDPAARYVHIADRLCEAGRLGRKTGAGYYRYAEGASRPQVDPAVHALIDAGAPRQGHHAARAGRRRDPAPRAAGAGQRSGAAAGRRRGRARHRRRRGAGQRLRLPALGRRAGVLGARTRRRGAAGRPGRTGRRERAGLRAR